MCDLSVFIFHFDIMFWLLIPITCLLRESSSCTGIYHGRDWLHYWRVFSVTMQTFIKATWFCVLFISLTYQLNEMMKLLSLFCFLYFDTYSTNNGRLNCVCLAWFQFNVWCQYLVFVKDAVTVSDALYNTEV